MINQSLHQNPSVMSPETLETLLVQRHELIDDLVQKHKTSLLSKTKHYSLLIGARGMGKSHLTSLLFHRLKTENTVDKKALILWMREEEWGVSSYLDLLIEILKVINRDYRYPDLPQQIDDLFNESIKVAEFEAEKLLQDLLKNKTALLLIENLDLVFDGLNKSGQSKLRALLQNTGQITIMATAPKAFAAVMNKNLPFYGFFNTINLNKLSLHEVTELLKKIAQIDGKEDLVVALDSDIGQMRVKALHHLANGNPRIYVIFSQFITADSLDEFTTAMMQLLNDLTPYYQAKMGTLSPQQRKLVMFMVRECGATAVKEIARKCHVTNQTASAQLKKLKDQGYVDVINIGRESYYELAEPLMRLVLGMKESKGTPAQIIIDLLRHWFSLGELKDILENQSEEKPGNIAINLDWVKEALESPQNIHRELALKEFNSLVNKGETKKAKEALNQLIKIQNPQKGVLIKEYNRIIASEFLSNVKIPYSKFTRYYENLNKIIEDNSDYSRLFRIQLFFILAVHNTSKIVKNHVKLATRILNDSLIINQIDTLAIALALEQSEFKNFIISSLKNANNLIKSSLSSDLYRLYITEKIDISAREAYSLINTLVPDSLPLIHIIPDEWKGANLNKYKDFLVVYESKNKIDNYKTLVYLFVANKNKKSKGFHTLECFLNESQEKITSNANILSILNYFKTGDIKSLLSVPKEVREIMEKRAIE